MLKAMLDSLDGMSDELKAHYTEKDGKFVLGIEPVGGFALENVEGLKTALSAEREAVKKAMEDMKLYEGLDVTKAREAMSKLDEMQNWTSDEKHKEVLESMKKQLLEKHNQELTARDENLNAVTNQLQHNLVTAEASKHLAKLAPNAVELLLPHVQSQAKMVKHQDGTYGVEILGDGGITRIGNNNGAPMTLEELVTEMSNDSRFAPAFKGAGASGSGADGTGAGGTGGTDKQINLDDLSGIEGIRVAREQMAAQQQT